MPTFKTKLEVHDLPVKSSCAEDLAPTIGWKFRFNKREARFVKNWIGLSVLSGVAARTGAASKSASQAAWPRHRGQAHDLPKLKVSLLTFPAFTMVRRLAEQ